jgi:hypothetical protein
LTATTNSASVTDGATHFYIRLNAWNTASFRNNVTPASDVHFEDVLHHNQEHPGDSIHTHPG